jgi:hypothetical protein
MPTQAMMPNGTVGLCRTCKARRFIHKRGRPHGSGLGQCRWPVARTFGWWLEIKRLGL